MHIVTASDDAYSIGVLVLIASAARHNPRARFSVLALDWRDANAERVERLAERLGCRIDLHRLDAASLPQLTVRRAHLTGAAFLRFQIPALLKGDERAIYMDCDMVVTGALDTAWDVALHDHPLAAVPCPSPTPAVLQAIDMAPGAYVNTGFLVMNLTAWRAEDLAGRCIAALMNPDCPYLSEDESAINDLCRGRIAALPPGYNTYACDIIDQPALADPPAIRVIHYVTRPKPWQGSVPMGAIWQAEAARIADLLPDRAYGGPRLWLRRFNRERRAWMGWLAGKARYRRLFQVRAVIRDRILAPYRSQGTLDPAGRQSQSAGSANSMELPAGSRT